MRRILFIACLLVTVALAQTVVEGGGRQVRGTPGHNAELEGAVFVLPRPGTITRVDSEGTDGFWIENSGGGVVQQFDVAAQATGYSLPAGSYRALPNLRDSPKADRSWVRITVTCP